MSINVLERVFFLKNLFTLSLKLFVVKLAGGILIGGVMNEFQRFEGFGPSYKIVMIYSSIFRWGKRISHLVSYYNALY